MTIEDKNKLIYEIEQAEVAIENCIDNLRKGILDGVSLNHSLDLLTGVKNTIAESIC